MIKIEQKELQKKLIQIEIMKEQSKQLQNQQITMSNQMTEIEITKSTLDELKKTKEGNDILIPLGGGVYASGKIGDVKNILIDIGTGVSVKKDISKAKEVLEEKQKIMRQNISNIEKELGRIDMEAQGINEELQKEMSKKQKQ